MSLCKSALWIILNNSFLRLIASKMAVLLTKTTKATIFRRQVRNQNCCRTHAVRILLPMSKFIAFWKSINSFKKLCFICRALPEGPRAVVISRTGEKRALHLQKGLPKSAIRSRTAHCRLSSWKMQNVSATLECQS